MVRVLGLIWVAPTEVMSDGSQKVGLKAGGGRDNLHGHEPGKEGLKVPVVPEL